MRVEEELNGPNASDRRIIGTHQIQRGAAVRPRAAQRVERAATSGAVRHSPAKRGPRTSSRTPPTA